MRGAKGKRRNGDEGIGRVEVAADQEPCDDRAEPAAAETPFMQQIEVAFAPMRGSKTEPSDEREQQDKNCQSDPVHVDHGTAPNFLFSIRGFSLLRA